MGFIYHGNGESTIGYTANGEASDWMLGSHNIISFSAELGNLNSFYPSKEEIVTSIERDNLVIDLFL